MPGRWLELDWEEISEFRAIHALSWAAKQLGLDQDYRILDIRIRKLENFDRTVLVEVQANVEAIGETGIMELLFAPDRIVVLDGQSAHIHDLASVPNMLRLDTEASAMDHLFLFCNTMLGPEGRFNVVSDISQCFLLSDCASKEVSEAVAEGVKVSRRIDGSSWEVLAPVQYADGMFRSTFRIDAISGSVEMMDDQEIEFGTFATERRHAQFRLKPERTE